MKTSTEIKTKATMIDSKVATHDTSAQTLDQALFDRGEALFIHACMRGDDAAELIYRDDITRMTDTVKGLRFSTNPAGL